MRDELTAINANRAKSARAGAGLGALNLVLLLAGGLAMAASQWAIFVHAPEEQVMGLTQKLFYLHLPLAWWGLVSFLLAGLAGAFYLAKRTPGWDALGAAALETGLLLAGLALFTGSIWARTAWNTWWTWDPRLSTALVMCFIYAGVLAVRRLDFSFERRASLSAVLSIVAFADVPLVFFSARLWPRTIHPSIVGNGGLAPEMLAVLLFCLAGLGVFWLGLVLLRCRQALAEQRLERLQILNGENHE
jgi:heme exporter protein C